MPWVRRTPFRSFAVEPLPLGAMAFGGAMMLSWLLMRSWERSLVVGMIVAGSFVLVLRLITDNPTAGPPRRGRDGGGHGGTSGVRSPLVTPPRTRSGAAIVDLED